MTCDDAVLDVERSQIFCNKSFIGFRIDQTENEKYKNLYTNTLNNQL